MNEQSKTCKEWEEYISAYIDGELSEEESSGVRQHLNDCANCQVTLDSFKTIVSSLKALPRLEMKRDVADCLPIDSGAKIVRPRFGIYTSLAAAAAVLILALAASIKPTTAPQAVTASKDTGTTNNLIEQPISESPEKTPVNREKTAKESFGSRRALDNPKRLLASEPKQRESEQISKHNTNVQIFSASKTSREDPVEIAVLSDTYDGSVGDALGIEVDEDGLYDIKI